MICHHLLYIQNISGDANIEKSNRRSVFYLLFTLCVQAAVAIESVSFECPKGEYTDANILIYRHYHKNHHLWLVLQHA